MLSAATAFTTLRTTSPSTRSIENTLAIYSRCNKMGHVLLGICDAFAYDLSESVEDA